MIKVNVDSLAHHVPEIRRARYDFKARAFRTSQGQPISDEMFRTWAAHRRMREARSGRSSIRRAVLLNTLLQTESGARPGLLEQVLQQSAKLVKDGLAGTIYQRPLDMFYSPLLRALEGAKQKPAAAGDRGGHEAPARRPHKVGPKA